MVTLSHRLRHAASGDRVLEIAIVGQIAPGSGGNADTGRIDSEVDSLFTEHAPAAVVLDLIGLKYAWGNGMIKVAHPADSVPVAVAATGETAAALATLLPLSYPDLPIVEDVQAARDWVDATLAAFRRGD